MIYRRSGIHDRSFVPKSDISSTAAVKILKVIDELVDEVLLTKSHRPVCKPVVETSSQAKERSHKNANGL